MIQVFMSEIEGGKQTGDIKVFTVSVSDGSVRGRGYGVVALAELLELMDPENGQTEVLPNTFR